MDRLWTCVAVALLLGVLASCGANDQASSGDPLADAFVDELARDADFPWFQALDRDETECFATTVLDTVGEQRRTKLRFAPDNIPLLFHADWSDSELDALTEIFAACVDDTTTGTEAYVLSLFGGRDRYTDCLVPEIISTLGEQYWLEAFRAGFSPPRIEMTEIEAARQAQETGDQPGLPGFVSDIEPIFAACDIPGYGDNADFEYAEDACGGEPCEDLPEPGDFRDLSLECSRDPYVPAGFYTQDPMGFNEWFPGPDACAEQERGTLISVQLLDYPCDQGPRDVKIMVTGETITEATVADACASSPPPDGPMSAVDSDLPTLDEPWDAESFTSPVASSQGVRLRRQTMEIFDGLLLSVHIDLRWPDDDARGGTTTALRVADGQAELIVGRWCNSAYSPALDAFDASVLFEGDSLVVCTPGEQYRSTVWKRPLATARIGQNRLALVVGQDGLDYVDLDTLQSRTILELDQQEDGVPLSASYGNEHWVLVLSTPDDDPADPTSTPLRHIVFLDSAGKVIDMANNPFPAPDADAPRAAALSDDGNTLVFSSANDDGSSTLVYWNLQTGAETQRMFIIEPQDGEGPYGFGRQWVSSIDTSGDDIIVNLTASNGETHPSGALLVNFDGNQEDLTDYDAHVWAAAFIDR